MNQTCKVCGEPAAGFHFGAFTCEGCKSFFGRSYNNLPSISDCKNNNECVINKKNRTSCKSCRLRKCLMVGMSKSGSRYGRRSNWFKIHCLLEEQQHQAEQQARAKKFHGEQQLVHLEKLNNNNSITCNKNLSPQISPKSSQIDEDKFTSTSPRMLQSYEEKYPSLSPRISPRTFGYTDHSISPSSVDMNMNYYSMFPQILLANNYHYYHQIKYQNKRKLEDEDEISEPGSERKEEQDENKSKRRYSNENYHPYSSNQINILQKEHYALDMQLPKHRSHSRNLSSERDEHERLYTHPLVDVSFRPGHISDREPMSDVEEQDVPIDLSVKSNVTEDKRMNVVCEDSDVDITTYGSDEETIDVTTVPRMKSSPLTVGLLDFSR